jgi:hypothetical protein
MSALRNTIVGGDIVVGPFKFSKFIGNLKKLVEKDNAFLGLWIIDPVSANLYVLYSEDPNYEFTSSIKDALNIIDTVGGKRKQRGGSKLVAGMAILILLYQMAIISATNEYKSYPNMKDAVSKWGEDKWRNHIDHDATEPVKPELGFFAWLFGFKLDLKDYYKELSEYNDKMLANQAEGEYSEHMMNLETMNAKTELAKSETEHAESSAKWDKIRTERIQAEAQYKTLEMLDKSADREYETMQLLIKVLIGVGVALAGSAFWLGRAVERRVNARVIYLGDPGRYADERGLPAGNQQNRRLLVNQNMLLLQNQPNLAFAQPVQPGDENIPMAEAVPMNGGRRKKRHTKKHKKRATRRR